MTSLYLLLLRHPPDSANAAATLAGLSNNRFKFGVGLGWMREEYEELNVPWRGRGKRFDEALDIMDLGVGRGLRASPRRALLVQSDGNEPAPSFPGTSVLRRGCRGDDAPRR